MAVKTTGAEFKAFYEDKDFWPEDNANYVWHEEAIILVDGVEDPEGIDTAALADSAEVRIEGGVVCCSKWDGNEPSLESYFRKWKKSRDTVLLVVECGKDKLEAVKAAVKAAGGKARA